RRARGHKEETVCGEMNDLMSWRFLLKHPLAGFVRDEYSGGERSTRGAPEPGDILHLLHGACEWGELQRLKSVAVRLRGAESRHGRASLTLADLSGRESRSIVECGTADCEQAVSVCASILFHSKKIPFGREVVNDRSLFQDKLLSLTWERCKRNQTECV